MPMVDRKCSKCQHFEEDILETPVRLEPLECPECKEQTFQLIFAAPKIITSDTIAAMAYWDNENSNCNGGYTKLDLRGNARGKVYSK